MTPQILAVARLPIGLRNTMTAPRLPGWVK
jgi:hypothetical protein